MDEARASSIVALGEAIGDKTPLLDTATAIEEGVFLETQGRQKYSSRMRMLVANVKRNERLRRDILNGKLSVEILLAMKIEELATDSMRNEVENLRKKSDAKRQRQNFSNGIVSKDRFKCRECSFTETNFVHLSDLRDVRKAETWSGSSKDDETKVLVQCLRCQSEWVTTTL